MTLFHLLLIDIITQSKEYYIINPNANHKARGVITDIPKGLYSMYTVTLENGGKVYGHDLPKRFKVGDKVCIQAMYSIVAEKYMINSIRKAPCKTRAVYEVQGRYEYSYGYETVCSESSRKEALERLKEYRENEPHTVFRLKLNLEYIDA